MDGLDGEIVATIQRCPNQMNSFVEMFLRAAEHVRNQEVLNVRLTINEDTGVDPRTHNRPTCDEVAAILLDENLGSEGVIILHQREVVGGLQRISDKHAAYDPLCFSLLFLNC
jgi:hypothetical protein